jgi:hypothetical protein
MKKLFLFLSLLVSLVSFGQTYNPAQHTVTNKSYGMGQAGPTDARSYFYDANNFRYRAYVDTAEVKTYLSLAKYRTGQFDIIVNSGGTLGVNGIITGGTNAVWYFKDSTGDDNLVPKITEAISYSATNGITLAASAFKLGGTGTENTTNAWGEFSWTNTFNGLTGNGLTVSSTATAVSTGSKLLNVTATGILTGSLSETYAIYGSNLRTGTVFSTTGVYGQGGTYGVFGISSDGNGVRGESTSSSGGVFQSVSGIGVWGVSTSNAGVVGHSSTGYALKGDVSNLGTGAIANHSWFTAQANGTPTNGFGSRFLYGLETSTTSSIDAMTIDWWWSNATHASRTSAFGISLVNNAGSLTRRFQVGGAGQITASGYGSGSFTGTVAKYSAWDASGNSIEVDPSAVTTDTTTIYANLNERPILTTLANLRLQTSPPDNAVYYVYDEGTCGFFKYDASDASSVDDSATLIVAGTKRFKRTINDGVLNPKWFGAKGDSTTDDTWAIQKTFNYVATTNAPPTRIVFPQGTYIISDTILLPESISGLAAYPWFRIDGAGATLKTSEAITIFYRVPSTMTQSNSYRDGYKATIENIYFEGDGDVNSKGMELGSTGGWVFRNLHFTNLDVGFYSAFSLEGIYQNLFFTLCKTDAFYGDWGRWTGATTANTAFNANHIYDIRVYCSSGQTRGFRFSGDGNLIEKIIIEGSKPVTGIDFDSDLSSVTNLNTVRQVWFEATGGSVTKSVNFKLKIVGDFTISDIQNPYSDTLVDWSSSVSSCNLYIDKLAYIESPTVLFKGGTISGMKLIFGLGIMNDVFDLTSTSYYSGGARPPVIERRYATAAVGSVWASSSDINFIPGSNSSNQRLSVTGDILIKNDNVRTFGGLAGSFNFRPNVGYFGTTGLYVDNTGRFRFGSATTTPDVTFVRDSIGRVSIQDNGSNYKDLKLQNITSTGTVYGTTIAATSLSVGTVDNTEFSYLDGVSSAIQTQLDLKAPLASPTFTGTVGLPSTTSVGTVSSTEIGYVDGVTSAIQTQIDSKAAAATTITIQGAGAAEDLSASRTFYPKFGGIQAMQALGSVIKATTLGTDVVTNITTSTAMVDGTRLFNAVWLQTSETITGVKFYQGTQGNFTGDNFNGIGLFSYSGGTLTQVAVTANDANIWKGTSGTWQTVAFTTPVALSPGIYYYCFMYNNSAETTAPTIGVAQPVGASGVAVGDFTNSAKLTANQTTQTTMPSSIAMTSLSSFTTRQFAALY